MPLAEIAWRQKGFNKAEEVICTVGPWNVAFARRIGVELPVRHTLAPIIKLRPQERAAYSLPAINYYESQYAIYRQRVRDRGVMYLGYNSAERIGDVNGFLAWTKQFPMTSAREWYRWPNS